MTQEPFAGAPHTVGHIRRLAVKCQTHTPVRLLAEEIVGRVGSKDYLSEILAIYYWVLGHTRYGNDPRNVELVRSAEDVLQRLYAHVDALLTGKASWKPTVDCDDLTTLLAALFLCLGREVQIVTVAFKDAFVNGQRQYSHVFIRVREPRTGTWIILDPVAAEGAAAMLSRVKAFKIWPIA